MYVEVDYDQQNIIPAEIVKNETVYIVDFHFTPEVMKEMVKITSHIFVFDHHKTGTEMIVQYPKEVHCHCDPGSKLAGCELVWNFLYSNDKMPRAVELIADRDKWAWKYGGETARFCEGLKLYPHQPADKIWEDLLGGEALVQSLCMKGDICLQYRDNMCKEFRNSWGYKVSFADCLCYVMNLRLTGVGSEMFAEKLDEYDICIGVVFHGSGWTISLRSNGKVDVSEIAERYGKRYGTSGGGHKKAAGFHAPELPFRIVE